MTVKERGIVVEEGKRGRFGGDGKLSKDRGVYIREEWRREELPPECERPRAVDVRFQVSWHSGSSGRFPGQS